MSDATPRKPQRTDIDAPISRDDAVAGQKGGYEIPGRDFAGTSRASDQREQTADHRGESRAHLSDDTVSEQVDQDRDLAPRDES